MSYPGVLGWNYCLFGGGGAKPRKRCSIQDIFYFFIKLTRCQKNRSINSFLQITLLAYFQSKVLRLILICWLKTRLFPRRKFFFKLCNRSSQNSILINQFELSINGKDPGMHGYLLVEQWFSQGAHT